MAKHKVVTTDAEIDRAIRAAKQLADEPRVAQVEYRPGHGLDLLIMKMRDGRRVLIPREDLEGLQHARREEIAEVEISPSGTALHWPRLDLDYYVPNLLRHIYGSKRWMSHVGRRGGKAKSAAKAEAARANGLKGGRPATKHVGMVA